MSKKKILFILPIVVVMVVFLCLTTPVLASKSSNETAKSFQIANVEVKQGDTLWSLAKEYYSEDYDNINEYIDEIKECNGMTEDKICTGGYLVIPYYQ